LRPHYLCWGLPNPGSRIFSLSQDGFATLAIIYGQFRFPIGSGIPGASAKLAQPIPLVNHSRHIPSIQTPLPGLYFASMSQVYPWDRGTNFAVEIGRRAARMMLG
jgi:hypothetical protein